MLDLFLYPLALLHDVFRRLITADKFLFALGGVRYVQWINEMLGPVQVYRTYYKARRKCPAYRKFLTDNNHTELLKPGSFVSLIPETNKENYVKKYSIEDRCYKGKIPTRGVVIDESSGSSGTPNNWVRGIHDRKDVQRLLQINLGLTFFRQNMFIINCFALGPWATGMNVSMALADVCVVKSIGPDIKKLENTLKVFGTKYKYLIAGYPPFIKMFVNSTELDLKKYSLHLVTGGEGISEGLRDYLSQYFSSVYSSYGASDLDINIGAESEFTIAVRKICSKNPDIARKIFGKEQVPMIFQYNPLDYYIETSADGELMFSVTRLASAAPKVRYNLKDNGGTMSCAQMLQALKDAGFTGTLPKPKLHFPILYVSGRSDLTVPFYGAKIYTQDLDAMLHETALSEIFHSFQMSSYEDDAIERYLKIAFELNPGKRGENGERIGGTILNQFVYDQLKRINQDFREVSKMFSADRIQVEIHEYESGPFSERDIRIKQKYIKSE